MTIGFINYESPEIKIRGTIVDERIFEGSVRIEDATFDGEIDIRDFEELYNINLTDYLK